ncbi:hypothetical protein [Actinomadura formosensis]|uniref:hypothetical protein n=1 Tax=Actinomadura formosensis TaxID=60706 RepID=UPI000A91506C|nr:hypothetical protein [Actinomadura formosensis]
MFAGVATTIIAAALLVTGIGGTLSSRDPSPGSLLPLQAASPSPADTSRTPSPEPSRARTREQAEPPGNPDPGPAERHIRDALLQLRSSVRRGVAAGDVRGDAGLDLTRAIERMLGRPRAPLARRRADVAYLHMKITTRAREGAITGGRAELFHLILDRATCRPPARMHPVK